jgi:hypothetical protein
MESKASQLIHTATPKERIKFLHELDNHYVAQNLYNRLATLWNKPTDEWTQEDEIEFNKCNRQHI